MSVIAVESALAVIDFRAIFRTAIEVSFVKLLFLDRCLDLPIKLFPPMPLKGIYAQLLHHTYKINHDPVVRDPSVLDMPEVHVTNLNSLACGWDPHELTGVNRALVAKCSDPLSLGDSDLVGADLLREGCLEGTLPVVLECTQSLFDATTSISEPDKAFMKEPPHPIDVMVVETIDHPGHHRK
jgi:hypothetical protein